MLFKLGTATFVVILLSLDAASAVKHWRATAFAEECSATCGGGVYRRHVRCADRTGATVPDNLCPPDFKPDETRPCAQAACPPEVTRTPSGPCIKCEQTVTVSCSRREGNGQRNNLPLAMCQLTEPASVGVCDRSQCDARWVQPNEMFCCLGDKTGNATCQLNGTIIGDHICNHLNVMYPKPKDCTGFCTKPPPTTETPIGSQWRIAGNFTECSRSCGGGQRTRQVRCTDRLGETIPENYCDQSTKPKVLELCGEASCLPFLVNVSDWMPCRQCKHYRRVECRQTDIEGYTQTVNIAKCNLTSNYASKYCHSSMCRPAWAPGQVDCCNQFILATPFRCFSHGRWIDNDVCEYFRIKRPIPYACSRRVVCTGPPGTRPPPTAAGPTQPKVNDQQAATTQQPVNHHHQAGATTTSPHAVHPPHQTGPHSPPSTGHMHTNPQAPGTMPHPGHFQTNPNPNTQPGPGTPVQPTGDPTGWDRVQTTHPNPKPVFTHPGMPGVMPTPGTAVPGPNQPGAQFPQPGYPMFPGAPHPVTTQPSPGATPAPYPHPAGPIGGYPNPGGLFPTQPSPVGHPGTHHYPGGPFPQPGGPLTQPRGPHTQPGGPGPTYPGGPVPTYPGGPGPTYPGGPVGNYPGTPGGQFPHVGPHPTLPGGPGGAFQPPQDPAGPNQQPGSPGGLFPHPGARYPLPGDPGVPTTQPTGPFPHPGFPNPMPRYGQPEQPTFPGARTQPASGSTPPVDGTQHTPRVPPTPQHTDTVNRFFPKFYPLDGTTPSPVEGSTKPGSQLVNSNGTLTNETMAGNDIEGSGDVNTTAGNVYGETPLWKPGNSGCSQSHVASVSLVVTLMALAVAAESVISTMFLSGQ